jgi:hypothetical protein
MLSGLKLFQVIASCIGSVTILLMKTKFITIFLLIGLLSQQAVSGVVRASMMGNFVSDYSSSTTDMSHHQHHEMASSSDMSEMSNTQMMDCCQSDCAYCIAGCYTVLSSQIAKTLQVFTQIPLQQTVSEPRVQSLDSPFRPPISA